MLGRELSSHLSLGGTDFIASDREVDIRQPAQLWDFARAKRIQWIINCAAYTAVDKAEDEKEAARKINAEGAGNVARTARRLGAHIIHISTDYVFDGRLSRPYREDDPVQPICVYGATKAEGEILVLRECSESFILRTAWLYGRFRTNFVHTMLKLMRDRESVDVVCDQRGAPTWASDLARAIISVIRSGLQAHGIYHYTNAGETNWYEFARAIHDEARLAGLLLRDCVVNPITSDQYPTKAKRPAYSVLSLERIASVLGIKVPHWRESLKRFIAELAVQIR
jgi:dTDP-4-dehydrorhamnose reductase